MSGHNKRRVVSINVSKALDVTWRGRSITTGIFKKPVPGPVMVRKLNIEGDEQADRRAHGGEYKAVYAYGAEHYSWWNRELGRKLPPGMFGENLTVEDLDEGQIHIGDQFRAGSALLEAVQPRQPCDKLGVRFDDPGMVKRFMESGYWGVYFRVIEEGEIRKGDLVECERNHPAKIPIAEIFRLNFTDSADVDGIRRLLDVPELCPAWRSIFEARLEALR